MIDATAWALVNDATLAIHEARDDLRLRMAFLEGCEALVPHQVSFFDLIGRHDGRDVFFNPVSRTMTLDQLAAYYSRYIDVDYTSWVQNQPESRPVYRDSDYITEKAKQASALYREWLEPMNVSYGCCCVVSWEGTDLGTVTFGRSEGDGDFTDDELEVLRVLERHAALRLHQLHPGGVSYRRGFATADEVAVPAQLTKRETEIVALIMQGISVARIAEALYITQATANRHLANIYRKLDVNSRAELMARLGAKQ